MTTNAFNPQRRRFLQISAAIGGGLLIGVQLPGRAAEKTGVEEQDNNLFAPNAWIRIAPDDTVTFMVDRSEMGQGVMTALPMLIAEELGIELGQIRTEFAPADEAYTNKLIGQQLTGGSTSVRNAWTRLRQAGAVGRRVLIQAAAKQWGVPEAECVAKKGKVLHQDGKRALSFGKLVETAAKLPVPGPDQVFLKDPEEFEIIGQSLPRLDSPQKVNGQAEFGMDVTLPGLLTASVLRCPVIGGKVKSFNAEQAKQVKGVKQVVEISSGIAVVAEGFWPALKARKLLEVEWEEGSNADLDSEKITELFKAALEKGGEIARDDGDIEAAAKQAAKLLEAEYHAPYQDHACMEPMNCVAHVTADQCEIWVPTQAQTKTQNTGMEVTGLPREAVRVHTTFLGGGFGRRGEIDFVRDAVETSKAVGAPVKVIWTREDDMMHGFYRPASYNKLRAMLDDQGQLLGWEHRIAGSSILSRVAPGATKDGLDRTSVEGAKNHPYAVPNVRVSYALENAGIPVGFWRSVGSSQNAFIVECFLDEVAAASGGDPLELRRALLKDHPRHLAALNLAAEKADWGGELPKGRARGLAVHESFGSWAAEVAEVSVNDQGEVTVHKVVCAIDCGMVVNPDIIRAQMESAVAYGLTATLYSAITIKGGQTEQSNFDSFPLLRMSQMPEVETYIVPSDESPGGVGEPGLPPIAPAVANAIFTATGKRIRHLPIRPEDLTA